VVPQDDKPATELDEIEDMHEITVRISMPRPESVQKKVIPTIRVVAGPDMLSYITVPEEQEIIVGRDEAADLQLVDATVSKRHARIKHEANGSMLVVDMNSTNGTAVNGQPVTRTILRPGDHLEIGGVSLRLDMLSTEELGHLRRVVSRLEAANRDSLTGLLNRKFIEEGLVRLVEKCERAEVPISCTFVDLDKFKSINDQYSHKVGDEVLRGISRLLMLGVRENDPAVRYGGDEIVFFLPGSGQTRSVEIADRIRRAVAGHDWDRTAPGLRVSCSFGVAERKPDESIKAWMDRADKAAYESKKGGRNRVSQAKMDNG
jgi:two-component system cell cycle response regulator